jgi:nucleotide-binding universal stress UspA family protein
MTRRFLVPLDGTPEALAILGPVEQLAQVGDVLILFMAKHPEHSGRIGVIPGNAVIGAGNDKVGTTPDVPALAETREQMFDRQIGEAKDYLETIAVGLREKGYEVEMEVELESDLGKAIIAGAKHTTVDIIAMLSKHHKSIISSFFDDDADEVLEAGIAPVLLIPQK